MKYTTLCWKCDKNYTITLPVCPYCGATNANVDPDAAYQELQKQVDGDAID